MPEPRYTIRRLTFITPQEFGDGHMAESRKLGLPWSPKGWAVLVAHDQNGRCCLATADPDYMRLAAADASEDLPEDLGDRMINNDKIVMVRPGWPEEWPPEGLAAPDSSWWMYLPPAEDVQDIWPRESGPGQGS